MSDSGRSDVGVVGRRGLTSGSQGPRPAGRCSWLPPAWLHLDLRLGPKDGSIWRFDTWLRSPAEAESVKPKE
eukprot:COSAG01_NODE_43114_length_433_cov_0.769461_1_plen_71_part_10